MTGPVKSRPYASEYFALGGIALIASVVVIGVLLAQLRPEAGRLWPFACALAASVYGVTLIYRGLSRALPQFDDVSTLEGLAPAVSIQSPARAATPPPSFGREVDMLRSMLIKRTPFVLPPSTITDRLLQAFSPKSLFASPEALVRARRYFAGVCAAAVFLTVLVVWVLFALIVLSQHLDYRMFAWTMLVYLAGLFFFSRTQGSLSPAGISSMFAFGAITIALMSVISANFRLGMPPSIAFILFGLGAVLAVVQMYFFFVLFNERTEGLRPGVQVSERSVDIRETLHPESLFQNLATVFDQRRWSQRPNICYLNFRSGETGLGLSETSRSGAFSGDLMLEMSPNVEPTPDSPRRANIAWTGVVLASVGVVAILVTALQRGFDFGIYAFSAILISGGVNLLGMAEFFHSEVLFRSQLVLFQSSGTFSTTRLTYGASVTSVSRAEDEMTRLDGRAVLYIANLVSGAFARVGASQPFSGVERFVLECNAEEGTSDTILGDWHSRISGQSKVPGVRADGPPSSGNPPIPGRPPVNLPPPIR